MPLTFLIEVRGINLYLNGCIRRENMKGNILGRLDDDYVEGVYLYGYIRRNAYVRGYEFMLTKDEVINLTKAACHYCGIMNSTSLLRNKGRIIKYNGIDRVDNTLGYTIDNCVTCCWQCNRAKATMSVSEYKAFIQRVYNYQESTDARVDNVGILREVQDKTSNSRV